MSEPVYDVVGLGNAIVDVISQADDAFLDRWHITKSAMNLIDEARADALTKVSNGALETSGGSGANTVAGVLSLGGRAAYFGKVANDRLGQVFRDDMARIGAPLETEPLIGGAATARSIIFVTPDGCRSMNTFLGATVEFSPEDLNPETIQSSALLYMEGYLFDKEAAKAAFVHAAEIAHAAGRRVSLTLSDSFCVDRHRASFRSLIANQVDVLFANEEELLSLYETRDFAHAVSQLRAEAPLAAITRSEKGSVVVAGGDPIPVSAEPVANVVDTTGAGDQYAAGFLFGLARGLPPETCARLGHIAAGEVITHYGPRPETPLADLAKAAGIAV